MEFFGKEIQILKLEGRGKTGYKNYFRSHKKLKLDLLTKEKKIISESSKNDAVQFG